MKEFDFDRASKLLTIAKDSLQWSGLKPIHDRAMAELVAMVDELVAPGPRPTEPKQAPVPPVNK